VTIIYGAIYNVRVLLPPRPVESFYKRRRRLP